MKDILRSEPTQMNLGILAAILSLAPLVTFCATYYIAMIQGHVPHCFPPISGCTDITNTGVYAPESYIFRGMLIPISVLIILFWPIVESYLRYTIGLSLRWNILIGITGAVMLIIATSVLQGKDTNWSIHTIGAICFFVMTAIAQIRVTMGLLKIRKTTQEHHISFVGLIIKFICSAAQIPLLLTAVPYPAAEWWLVFTMSVYFGTFAMDWRGKYVVKLVVEQQT